MQLSHQFQAVRCVSGKSADGLGDNEIYLLRLTVGNQTHQLRTLLLLGSGDALVVIKPSKFPVITNSDIIFIVVFLCFQTFQLRIAVSGNAAISGHTELMLWGPRSLHTFDFANPFHGRSPP